MPVARDAVRELLDSRGACTPDLWRRAVIVLSINLGVDIFLADETGRYTGASVTTASATHAWPAECSIAAADTT
jgi:hypothetical protein